MKVISFHFYSYLLFKAKIIYAYKLILIIIISYLNFLKINNLLILSKLLNHINITLIYLNINLLLT